VSDRILVCDPNPQMQRALRVVLRDAGYKALIVATGQELLERVAELRPAAVILELVLPDASGIDLCRALRRVSDTPIVVVSTVDDALAKIEALENGADDYLTKPFVPGELVARLAARMRSAPSGLKFERDGLLIDFTAHQAAVGGQEIHLTATEFALLRVLATSRGTVPYRTLAKRVWGPLRSDAAPRIRTHVANLRAKLDPGQVRSLIETDIGVGYRFARRR
jgi:two-component system, OmpR family, KDP operon response regulator KdpE